MEIKPFKGFRFNPKVVGDVGNCIAPPFDVIGPVEQQQLYEKSEYNIARITKGKTSPSDNEHNNQYTRAAEYLNSWIKSGVLKQDVKEAIYAYVQDFRLAPALPLGMAKPTVAGAASATGAEANKAGLPAYRRLSFIALTKLEEFGDKVRPHEEVFEKPMTDRLNLKRATAARFGLVFMLYEDKQKIAEKIIEKLVVSSSNPAAAQKPLADFIFEDIRQRLFAINNRDDIDVIVKMMSDKSCIIADGHHRYMTGLAYSKESSNPAAKYQMLSFSNICQDGLKLLATHRLVGNLENFKLEKFIADLKENFEVTKLSFGSDGAKAGTKQNRQDALRQMIIKMQTEYNNDRNAFGIYGGNSAFYVAVLKDKRAMDLAVPDKSDAWKSLDVSILHKLVLERLLGIDEQKIIKDGNIEYVKGIPDAIDDLILLVDSGQKQVLFLLNPVKMQQLQMVTAAGERMPHKSTYFYPKMYTGLVIHKL
jgi:uncharacterized protein (DUF1015 family)